MATTKPADKPQGDKPSRTEHFLVTCLKVTDEEHDGLNFTKIVERLQPRIKIDERKAREIYNKAVAKVDQYKEAAPQAKRPSTTPKAHEKNIFEPVKPFTADNKRKRPADESSHNHTPNKILITAKAKTNSNTVKDCGGHRMVKRVRSTMAIDGEDNSPTSGTSDSEEFSDIPYERETRQTLEQHSAKKRPVDGYYQNRVTPDSEKRVIMLRAKDASIVMRPDGMGTENPKDERTSDHDEELASSFKQKRDTEKTTNGRGPQPVVKTKKGIATKIQKESIVAMKSPKGARMRAPPPNDFLDPEG